MASTPYRVGSSGRRDDRTFHIYGYSFKVDSKKTALSFTLPPNRRVLVFGLMLVRGLARPVASVQRAGSPEQHQNTKVDTDRTNGRTNANVTLAVSLNLWGRS